jgi:hypothetical protein
MELQINFTAFSSPLVVVNWLHTPQVCGGSSALLVLRRVAVACILRCCVKVLGVLLWALGSGAAPVCGAPRPILSVLLLHSYTTVNCTPVEVEEFHSIKSVRF